jgi:membrane protein required for colicin V production
MLPDDPENTILKRFKRPKEDEGEEQPAAGQRSDNAAPRPRASTGEGYDRSDRTDMRQLIETRTAR